jgi:hypothetical protein
MSQNQEIIESKLCAYVDGELDPEGRAEIEKHLDANPQHRRLLESLRATRDLLRWLPREQAPPELAETLNGQLERSVLLDYEGDGLKVAIWPRVFAAAAIIILTAGLGAAVFYALPRSQKPALARSDSGSVSFPVEGGQNLERPFASSATAPSDAGIDAPRTAGGEPVDRTERAKDNDDSRKELALAKDGAGELHKGGFTALDFMDRAKKSDEAFPAAPAPGGGRKLELSDLDELAQQVAQNPDVFAAAPIAAHNATTQPVSTPTSNAMVMLVRSDAPEQTEKLLTSYFKTQQIQWRQTQLPAQQLGLNGQNLGAQNQLASAAPGNSQTVLAPNGQQEKQQSVVLKDASQKPLSDISLGKAGKTADLKSDQLHENLGSGLNHSTETRPTGTDALPSRPEAPVAAAQNRFEPETVNAAPALQQQGRFIENGSNVYRSNGVYVVQMSRRQAAQLCTTISNDPSQAALTKDLNGLSYSNSSSDIVNSHTMPAAEQQSGDNGRNVYGLKSSSPTTNSALRQAFREQMKVAAGASDADFNLKRSIEARGAQDKAPTTRPAEVATLEKPIAGESEGKAFAAPTPSRHFIGGANAPATQPADAAAAPTTAPSDEPMSVVILVEASGSPAALPAAAVAPVPSTQPIGLIEQVQSPAASQPGQNAK